MKIVAIIPARYGSTRFPNGGKSLAEIAGKRMIQRVYENVQQSKMFSQILVATDDQRIFEVVEKFGGNALMTSGNCRSGTDRAAEAAKKIGLADDDIVVNIQGDQPWVDPKCLDEVVDPLRLDSKLEMSTLAYVIQRKDEITNPRDVKVIFDNKGFALYFSRSTIPHDRDGDTPFDTYKHLGIYAYKVSFLETFASLKEGKLERIEKLEQLRALEYGHRIKVVITEYDSPEVDFPEDITRIEANLKNGSYI